MEEIKWYEMYENTGYDKTLKISCLEGYTIKEIIGLESESDVVILRMESGEEFCFLHKQDCCEDVRLIDYELSSHNLLGGTIISAEERTSEAEEGVDVHECGTYTFYNIQTTKGILDMRWLGESNGYYSESVDIFKRPEV